MKDDAIERLQAENKMYELAVEQDDEVKTRYANKICRLDGFLQDIESHLRATPDPLPYIVKTMRKYIDYREGR